jgi:hypothetical protein
MVNALNSQSAVAIASIPMAAGFQRKLVNPQGALAFDLIGNDAQSLTQPPAPRFDSDEAGSELIQHYWMALSRDVPFETYAVNSDTLAAISELNVIPGFKGPWPVNADNLFRGKAPGCNVGPYISQFLYLDCPYGANNIDQKIAPPRAGLDFMKDFPNYLNIQNGRTPLETAIYDSPRRYMATARDLAAWVHVDVLWQAYFMATLQLMGVVGAPVNPTNPYVGVANQGGFATFGGPHFATLVVEVATRALHTVW